MVPPASPDRLVFALSLGLLISACGAPEPRGDARPDLVIVTVDTLRADRLGPYNAAAARTPTLDALAARGARFDQATTPFPRTTPALASLHTGLQPAGHGSREVGQPRTGGVTLAERLAAQGYATVGLSAMKVAGPEQGMDAGFGVFEVMHDAPARRLSARALTLADGAEREQPLFLWVHYADPHFPYGPPAGADQPEAPACRALVEAVESKALKRERLFSDRDGAASAALADCRALYDAEIAYTDAAIGRLLAGLEERGRMANTLVFFSADHGENQGEEGLYYEHGPSLADASLRVPLIVAGPGVIEGRVDPWPATLEDVLPTALALLGAEAAAPPVDGISLAERLGPAPPADAERLVFSESGSALHLSLYDYPVSGRLKRGWCVNDERYSLCLKKRGTAALYDHVADPDRSTPILDQPAVLARLEAAAARWPPEQARLRAARGGGLKLVETPSLSGGYTRALFDVNADPAQTTDLFAARPEDAARLGAALDAWTGTLPPPVDDQRDAETTEALRALGYLD